MRRVVAALAKRWLALAERPEAFAPVAEHAATLREHLEAYQELPPVFRPPPSRSGTAWPTVPPLLERVEEPWQRIFLEEADTYRWICYARLRP